MADIRNVNYADLAECLTVIQRGFATVAADFGLNEQNAPTNGAFMKAERLESDYQSGKQMFACVEAGRIVGFAQIAEKGNGIFELEKLAVLPEYRGRGFGGRLIDHAKETASSLGGTKITIGIIEENDVLRRWYLKHGFTHTGTRKFDHLPFTVGFMELTLATDE